MIVFRQIKQIGFQILQDFRKFALVEIIPILGLDAVRGGVLFFRFDNQAGKTAFKIDLYHPHAEQGRLFVNGISFHESVISGGGVTVAAFVKIEFRQIAVNAVFIGAGAVFDEPWA